MGEDGGVKLVVLSIEPANDNESNSNPNIVIEEVMPVEQVAANTELAEEEGTSTLTLLTS